MADANCTISLEDEYLIEDYSDLLVYVGPNKINSVKIPALKSVLSNASPVFTKMMIEGHFKESETGEIFITDIKPHIFKKVLLFLHNGSFNATSMDECLDMLQVADKYFMNDLKNVCLDEMIKYEITSDTFWQIFENYHRRGLELTSEQLIIKTYTFLDDNARQLVTHENFQHLDHSVLSRIIQRGTLKIDERLLFDSTIIWSKAECRRKHLNPNPENQRKVLGNVLFLIRFFRMSREKFKEGPGKCGILTTEEVELMLRETYPLKIALPPPWNNQLLACPRETFWSLSTMYICRSINWETTCFVYSNDAMVQSIDVWFSKASNVNVVLSELSGVVLKSWDVAANDNGYSELPGFNRLEGPLFLKECTCYKLDITNQDGNLKVDFCHGGPWGDRFGDQTVFFTCRLGDIKDIKKCLSSNYWKKVFGCKPPTHDEGVIPKPSKVCLIFAMMASFC